jgi:hypothetical protein
LDVRLLCWRGAQDSSAWPRRTRTCAVIPKESFRSPVASRRSTSLNDAEARVAGIGSKIAEVHKNRDRVVLIEDTREHMGTIIPMLSGVAALVTADSPCG